MTAAPRRPCQQDHHSLNRICQHQQPQHLHPCLPRKRVQRCVCGSGWISDVPSESFPSFPKIAISLPTPYLASTKQSPRRRCQVQLALSANSLCRNHLTILDIRAAMSHFASYNLNAHGACPMLVRASRLSFLLTINHISTPVAQFICVPLKLRLIDRELPAADAFPKPIWRGRHSYLDGIPVQ